MTDERLKLRAAQTAQGPNGAEPKRRRAQTTQDPDDKDAGRSCRLGLAWSGPCVVRVLRSSGPALFGPTALRSYRSSAVTSGHITRSNSATRPRVIYAELDGFAKTLEHLRRFGRARVPLSDNGVGIHAAQLDDSPPVDVVRVGLEHRSRNFAR